MAEHNRDTPPWSMPDTARGSVRLPGVTVPRAIWEAVRAAAGEERGAASAVVREALAAWLAARGVPGFGRR
jgi:hypothetical protein